MFALTDGVVILRDFIKADIEDYVRWETVETEWKLWDAPWEHVGQTDAQRAAALADDVAWMREHAREVALLRDDAPRRRFEICGLDEERAACLEGSEPHHSEGRACSNCLHSAEEGLLRAFHIGSVSTYRIDDDFCIAQDGPHLAVGIDINSIEFRGHGYAVRALRLLIDYLLEAGERELYCQTWSGNARMIKLALKLGFVECCRKPGLREVRGQRYDGLTFVLKSSCAFDR